MKTALFSLALLVSSVFAQTTHHVQVIADCTILAEGKELGTVKVMYRGQNRDAATQYSVHAELPEGTFESKAQLVQWNEDGSLAMVTRSYATLLIFNGDSEENLFGVMLGGDAQKMSCHAQLP